MKLPRSNSRTIYLLTYPDSATSSSKPGYFTVLLPVMWSTSSTFQLVNYPCYNKPVAKFFLQNSVPLNPSVLAMSETESAWRKSSLQFWIRRGEELSSFHFWQPLLLVKKGISSSGTRITALGIPDVSRERSFLDGRKDILSLKMRRLRCLQNVGKITPIDAASYPKITDIFGAAKT